MCNKQKYFDKLNSENELEFKNDALNRDVPIIKDDSLELLIFILKMTKAKRVLEIGTAVGYSAISMAIKANVQVDTIEKNEKMYLEALTNVKNMQLDDKINCYHSDALTFDNSLLSEYDLIFIDAAKAQYQRFFEKYTPLLKEGGIVFSDNLLFHGYVEKYVNNEDISSKDLRALARKINNYNQFLKDNKSFETMFLEIGDGIAISIKK